MKKLIAIALLFTGMIGFAQEKSTTLDRKAKRAEIAKLSPEQRNQLELKKLTLELDLTASQQTEMAKIIAEQNERRKSAKSKAKGDKKPTTDEIFVMKSKMLDEKIATKEKIKKILSPEQVEKWEKINKNKRSDFKRGMKKQHVKKIEKKQE